MCILYQVYTPIDYNDSIIQVYLAKKKQTEQYFAIKIMNKDDLIRKNMVDQVVNERDALALAKSPFIVKLFYSFQVGTNNKEGK